MNPNGASQTGFTTAQVLSIFIAALLKGRNLGSACPPYISDRWALSVNQDSSTILSNQNIELFLQGEQQPIILKKAGSSGFLFTRK